MFKLKIKYHFDAAHRLLNYKGDCANFHGHTYELEFILKTNLLIDDMVLDFKEVKSIIKRIIDNGFDHKNLNEVVDYNPTAENLVKDIYLRTKKETPMLYSVELWEGIGTSIKYYEE